MKICVVDVVGTHRNMLLFQLHDPLTSFSTGKLTKKQINEFHFLIFEYTVFSLFSFVCLFLSTR